MMQLEEIRQNAELVDAIDWDMTPEEAVRLYLEWGNNWARSNYVIRSNDDVAHYFVISTWKEPPVIYLVRRNTEEAVDLAEINMPEDMKERYLEENGYNKGVYAVEGEVRQWLRDELGTDS